MCRIQLYSEPCLVDPVIPGMQLVHFEDPDSFSNESKEECDEWNADLMVNILFTLVFLLKS